MSTWPSPSGFRLTACAAPAAPSAPIPASAAHSDFFLKIFMVGDDSVELPFKVITLEQQRPNLITVGVSLQTNRRFLHPFCRLFATIGLAPIHEPCLTLRD